MVISQSDVSIFTGYFDVNCINNDYLYYHIDPTVQQLSINPKEFGIGRTNLKSGETEIISHTYACNYQLGARLHFPETDRLFFNDVQDGYICMRELELRGDNIIEKRVLPGGYFSAINTNSILQVSFHNIYKFRDSYGYAGKDSVHRTIKLLTRNNSEDDWFETWNYQIADNFDYANNILVDKHSGTFCWLEVSEGVTNKNRYNKLMFFNHGETVTVDLGHISHCFFYRGDLYYTKLEEGTYNLYKFSMQTNAVSLVIDCKT